MTTTSERLMGGPRQSAAVVPTASQSVRIEADDRVAGVRLKAVASDSTSPEDAALLLEFSPDFVVFPDATAKAGPPFKDGRNDYHPRPVEAFMDGAHPYVATPGGLLAGLYVAAVAALAIGIGAFLLLVTAVRFDAARGLVPLLAISTLAAFVTGVALLSATPRTTMVLRQRVGRGEGTSRLGVRRSQLDLPDTIWALQSWADYQRRVVDSERYPRTTYGRVVAMDGDRYLQYWQFYVFNDWHNRHEADWELVLVRVSPKPGGGWRPRAAAYSSHFGGHWRSWEDLESRHGTHPVVYVARGSHAQYFESRADGYRATLTQPLALLEFRIRLIFQNDWTDVVAAATGTEEEPYRIEVIPQDLETRTWTEADLRAWWWLRFDGLWGAREAIPGPRSQGVKWTDPPTWVRLFVDRDVGDLDEFTVAEAPA